MTALPSWYPDPDEAKAAPMPLLRVQGFVNTLDVDAGTDLLSEPQRAAEWLVLAGLTSAGEALSATDLELARGVRGSIRGLLLADGDGGGQADDLEPLRNLTGAHLARLTVGDDGMLGLENAQEGSLGCGLFDLLLIVREAQQEGSWSRLRGCANPECQWVFYDRSRNQQGNWCDMAVCGNRMKNRQLRARRR
jgi:predicted RNA-binding Zn ribbon-like protein